MNICCLYHSSDLDGKLAAAIVYRYFGGNVIFYGVDYNNEDEYKKIIDTINSDDLVIIVDYSFDNETFKQLLNKTENVIWIDHHISAIEINQDLQHLPGIRIINYAACELTWMYFYPDLDMPMVVKYAGRYDIWNFTEFDRQFLNRLQSGIRLMNIKPNSPILQRLLDNDIDLLNRIMNDGKKLEKFKTSLYASIVNKFAFKVKFNGYSAICCNIPIFNAQIFDTIQDINDYDFKIIYAFNGKKYKVTLYSSNIDCSIIARQFGGGGHKGAAGFMCNNVKIDNDGNLIIE